MRVYDESSTSPEEEEGPGSHEYRMLKELEMPSLEERKQNFLQVFPELVLHVEVGEDGWVAGIGTP